ncbi:MAG: hypothetical protein QOK44_5478, partial [Betaproteobacteria bacterium]|nr:hypothetical protein [Betaproteobacteria bacterium]
AGQIAFAHQRTSTAQPLIASGGTPVIQRKITPDRLNVVGETHSESEPRRGQEKEYTNQVTKGGYWLEQEFKYSAGADDKASEAPGDPVDLRITQRLVQLNEYTDLVIKNIDDLDNKGFPGSIEQQRLVIRDSVVQLGVPTANLPYELGREGAPKAVAYQLEGGKTVDAAGLKDLMQLILADAGKMLQELAAVALDAATQRESKLAQPAIEKLRSKVADHKQTIGKWPRVKITETRQQVREQRSAVMAAAASREAARKGVWKIGELHVHDMLQDEKAADKRAFELTTKDEFNQELAAYEKKKKDAEPKQASDEKDKKKQDGGGKEDGGGCCVIM